MIVILQYLAIAIISYLVMIADFCDRISLLD